MADEYDPAAAPEYDATDDSYQNGEYAYDQQDGGDDEEAEEEDDDYDPSSFSFGDNAAQQSAQQEAAPPVASQPTQPELPSKPKTAAGFIIEESDDEEDEDAAPPPSQLNGTKGAQSGLGAVAVSEARDVSLASEPTQDTAAAPAVHDAQNASLNGSIAAVATTLPVPADVASSTTTSPVSALPFQQVASTEQGKDISPASTAGAHATASVSATPKPAVNGVTAPPSTSLSQAPAQRLPHDKVGRLEDRLKEDPKADTDAWLSLISHYREKDQLDNARRVYDRFLEVFPTAVCSP